ncbi:MAG: GNAT family N-acetyltransferase [Clostridia bacterium]|nr:GNAT family N-acetyltransferase [Clostridia bacterium]
MKITVQKGMTMEDLVPYLMPVEKFGEEKKQNGCWDDWDEAAHTRQWLEKVLDSINGGNGDVLDVWCLEQNGEMAGSAFVLSDSRIVTGTMAKDHIAVTNEPAAQFTCFHILEKYRSRGLGGKWMTEEIFRDLREQGIRTVYIRSSHHNALPLYERLGTLVGNYISVSDHQIYRRYGYVYAVEL